MRRAIDLARRGMRAGEGGPFGCVIARGGEILGEGWNRVLADCDPTAHGEITAIRDACARQRDFSLSGAELFTTGKPCPMCLGAILWARISKVYYGFNERDAAAIGFDDAAFYEEFKKEDGARQVPSVEFMRSESMELLDEYRSLNPVPY